MKYSPVWNLCLGILTGCLVGCGGGGDGLVKHPVHGQVLVNGKPYGHVIVRFHHTDPAVTKNAARPIGVTNENGEFELSTNGDKDGAVSGEYLVTFLWNDGATTVDFLKGKYSKPEQTTFRVTIGNGDEELPTFELETSENNVAAATTQKSRTVIDR